MVTASHRRFGILAGLAVAALLSLGAQGQPAPAANNNPPPAADGNAGDREGARDWLPRQWFDMSKDERAKRLREFLEVRRERLIRTNQAIDHALKSMDEGVDIDRVIADFPADLRPGFGRRPGGPRGDHADARPENDPVLNNPDRLGPASPNGEDMGSTDDRRPGPAAGRGRGPGGGGGGEMRAPGGPVTNADRETFDEFLGSAAPRLQTLMRQLRQTDPERADRKVREAMTHMHGLLELREKDRPMYDLRLKDIRAGREAMEAARAVVRHDRDHSNGDDAQGRERLIADLRQALASQYEVRGEILEREVARMQGDLARRQEELTKRPSGKDGAIDRNTNDLLRRARERWPGRPHAGPEDDAPPPAPPPQPPSGARDPSGN